ncbi:MAG: hypothetical protein V8S08_08320 [Lachnoclostridium sp.]
MDAIDLNDETVQQGIRQMKEGLDLSFESGMDISVGDYAVLVQSQMAGE